jgi:hypothetical protein
MIIMIVLCSLGDMSPRPATVDTFFSGPYSVHYFRCTGHTQKNGAVSI